MLHHITDYIQRIYIKFIKKNMSFVYMICHLNLLFSHNFHISDYTSLSNLPPDREYII